MDTISPVYNYVVTAHRPTAVTHAIQCSFTSPSERNLILGKCSYFEVLLITKDGLISITDVPIYGRIATMMAFRLPGHGQDHLFICTERYSFCVLMWDTDSQRIITRYSGTIQDSNLHRQADNDDGPIGLVDQVHGVIALYLFEGVLKCLRLNKKDGKLIKTSQMRLDDCNVIAMCFLEGYARPALAVLYSDPQDLIFLKTYTLSTKDDSLEKGPFREVVPVEGGASKLIPVPHPFGGVLVIGSESVSYINAKGRLDAAMDSCKIECWEMIDRERYLLGDVDGNLVMILLRHDSKQIKAVQIENSLGKTVQASTLTYLDNAYVFVGSVSGDSTLIRLTTTKNSDGNYIDLVERFPNLGPILDFVVVDLDRQGQGMMVCCSGVGKDGTLRAVRNGIGITPDATMEVLGMCGLWSLSEDTSSPYDHYLVLSFAAQTIVMALTEQKGGSMEVEEPVIGESDRKSSSSDGAEGGMMEVLEQVEVSGFDNVATTIFATNLIADCLLQVTPFSCRVVSCKDLTLISTWKPQPHNNNNNNTKQTQVDNNNDTNAMDDREGATEQRPPLKIQKAYAEGKMVIVALTNNSLVLLRFDGHTKTLKEINSKAIKEEVTCLSLVRRPLTTSGGGGTAKAPSDQKQKAMSVEGKRQGGMEVEARELVHDAKLDDTFEGLVAVGLWDGKKGVMVLQLPSLAVVATQSLGGQDQIARSLAFCKLGSVMRVLIGMGDGHLVSFELRRFYSKTPTQPPLLSSQNKVALGTNPVSLTCFENKEGDWHVMACCDRPTVAYCAKNRGNRLLYNNVNLRQVRSMARFRTPSCPEALAFATQGNLIVGTADAIQKLHVSTIRLNEQPRRIAYQKETSSFLVTCEAVNAGELNHLRIADGQTFEWVASIPLEKNETAASNISIQFEGSKSGVAYFCVGTAFILPNEDEPTKGRVLVLQYQPNKNVFSIVAQVATPGTVYCLEALNGKLVAGINSHVQLYKWEEVQSNANNNKAPAANMDMKVLDSPDIKNSSSNSIQGRLVPVCSHRGHIVALNLSSYGEYVVVGDMMKSLSLLMYTEESKSLVEIARDYTNKWMTAVTMVDDQVYLGTEDQFHLFSSRRKLATMDDQERRRLETVGMFHLGEFVNRFKKGSLVMHLPERESKGSGAGGVVAAGESGVSGSGVGAASKSTSSASTPHLFATINGVIGVVASLTKRQYHFLKKVEGAMERVVQGVGGLSHRRFRAYLTPDNRYEDSKYFVDGDLVEKYLSLDPKDMQKVAKILKMDVDVIMRHIETAARVH